MNNFQKVNQEISIEDVIKLCGYRLDNNDKLSQCPYHPDDKYRHANIVPGKNFVFCHCDNDKSNLSVIDYYKLVNNLSALDAMRDLARIFNIKLSIDDYENQRSDLPKWHHLYKKLRKIDNSEAIEYLTEKRKINKMTVDALKSEKILLHNKALKISKDSKISGDALSLPIRSFVNGNIVGFWNRYISYVLDEHGKVVKNKSMGEVIKSGAFFFISKVNLIKANEVWIFETIIDALSLFPYALELQNTGRQIGIISLLSANNAAVDNVNIEPLYGKSFRLCFDADNTGFNGAKRLYKKLTYARQDAQIVHVCSNGQRFKDWNEILCRTGFENMINMFKSAAYRTPIVNSTEGLNFPIIHKKSQAYTIKTVNDELREELISDFEIRGVKKLATYDHNGNPDPFNNLKTAYIKKSTSEESKFPLKVITFKEGSSSNNFNKVSHWEEQAGVIFDTRKGFKHYIAYAERMIDPDPEIITPFIGIVKDPTNPSKYLVSDNLPPAEYNFVHWDYKFPTGTIHNGRKVIEFFARIGLQCSALVPFYHSFIPLTRPFNTGGIPHLFVVAHKDSGKSKWMNTLKHVFGYNIGDQGQIDTPHRLRMLLNNCSIVRLIDEVSRFSTEKAKNEFINFLARTYDPRDSYTHNDARKWNLLGALSCWGQDFVSDSSVITKAIRICIDNLKNENFNPVHHIHNLPQFPLREFCEYIIQRQYSKPLETEIQLQQQHIHNQIDIGLGDRDRFLYNWASLFAIRKIIREFLELEQGILPELSSEQEVVDLINFMKINAEDLRDEAKESVEMLKAFASISTTDTYGSCFFKSEGNIVYLQLSNILQILRKNSYNFALNNEKRFKKALVNDGLFSADINNTDSNGNITPQSKRFDGKTKNVYSFDNSVLKMNGIIFDVEEVS